MTLVEEAQLMAGKKTSGEIDALTKGRERTDIEHLAYMFALQGEIEARIASKKAETVEKERKYDSERDRAEAFYNKAKEDMRIEKERHRIANESFEEEKAKHRAEKKRHQSIEAGFIEEKHRHRDERERHAKAVAQFQKDAEPWRKIVRAEKEEERAFQANQDAEFDASLEEQKTNK